jgi:hypothetical protein
MILFVAKPDFQLEEQRKSETKIIFSSTETHSFVTTEACGPTEEI